MVEFVQDVIDSIGYVGIAVLTIVENIFPPIPSEVVLPFAGFAAKRGDLTLIGVVIAGTVGSVLGALPLYYLGYRLGEERIAELAEKYGNWVGVTPRDIKRANRWFKDHGQLAVFICRMIPGLRSVISIPAGTAKMNLFVFLGWTTIGTALWTAALGAGGYLLGQNYDQIKPVVDAAGWVVFAIVVLLAIRWLWQRRDMIGSETEEPTT